MKVVPYPFQSEGVQGLRAIEWPKFMGAIGEDLRKHVHPGLIVRRLSSWQDLETDEELVFISLEVPGVEPHITDNMQFMRIPMSLKVLTPYELKDRLIAALKSLIVMLQLLL